jgi:predicted nuclease of restriction endonuclease-like (RecB) superfamily
LNSLTRAAEIGDARCSSGEEVSPRPLPDDRGSRASRFSEAVRAPWSDCCVSDQPRRRGKGRELEPRGYAELLTSLKAEARAAQLRAHRVVNTELLTLYWTIGRAILDRQAAEGWGTRVINRLADDLRAEFSNNRGFGRSNVHYMRAMAQAWTRDAIVQQPVGQLPWGHVTVLLDKLDDQHDRDWYAAKAVDNGWTRNVLLNQIIGRLHLRAGVAPTNFELRLPAADSELAQQLTKDPYVFDFLDLTDAASERELEQGLMDSLQRTLSEFGRGFSFVGRQVHFEVDGRDFFADLVFFHVEQLRYVVVELKIGRFEPEYTGQLGFYVSLVDDRLRLQDRHAPTVGILLCAERNDRVVRYALTSAAHPIAVADYTYAALPRDGADALPSAGELAEVVNTALTGGR